MRRACVKAMRGAVSVVYLTAGFWPQATAERSMSAAATPRPRRSMRTARANFRRSALRLRARHGASAVFSRLPIQSMNDVLAAEPGPRLELSESGGLVGQRAADSSRVLRAFRSRVDHDRTRVVRRHQLI